MRDNGFGAMGAVAGNGAGGRVSRGGWYVARVQFRRRAGSTLALALIVALVVAGALACATAARRSHSALDRLRSSARTTDVTLLVPDSELADRISGLPVVEQAANLAMTAALPANTDEFLPVLADRNGTWLRELDRVRVLDGALPPVDDPDGIVLTEATAELLGIGVGDELAMKSLTSDEIEQLNGEDPRPPSFAGPRFTLRVAAIVRTPPTDDDPNAEFLSVVTPAFLRDRADLASFGELVLVRLEPGSSLVDLTSEIRTLPGGEAVDLDAVGTGGVDGVRTALDTVALGLAALALAVALAGLVVAGQAVTRLVQSARADAGVLEAIGLAPSAVAAATSAAAVVAIVGGITAGTLVAPFVAPSVGGDLARRVDPDFGTALDWAVLGFGAVTAFVVLMASAVASARWYRSRRAGTGHAALHTGLAGPAARAGLPGTFVAGLSLAFSRGGARVPTRQAVASALVGVVGIAGVTVLGASLDHTLHDPEQYGWGWEATLDPGLLEDPDDLERRRVTDVALVTYDIEAHLGGRPLPAMTVRQMRGRIDPVLVRGGLPDGVDEVLVGEQTLDDLGLGIDDVAELSGPNGSAHVRVVGTTALASFDDPLPLARGVFIQPELVDELGLAEDSIDQLAVVVDGDARAAFADLAPEVRFPSPPIEVDRLDEVRIFPALLAGFLALLAAVSVGHALAVTVRRRRGDLGVLKAVGFTTRQARQAVLASAAVVVATSLLVGVPLGVVAGRLGWRLVTSAIGLPFRPVLPLGWLATMVLVVIGAAGLAATPATWTIGRMRLAEALRAE